jgi:hypothetical protein
MAVTVIAVKKQIDAHEDLCSLRYEGIETQMRAVNARLKRLEQIMIACAGAVIVSMAGFCITLMMTLLNFLK